jgi:hypothetical protein
VNDARGFTTDAVKSSYIDVIAYNEATQELRVQFKSGATWKYRDVPPAIHVSLLLSESTGKYFAKEVRGVFGGRKIEPGEEL